MTSVAKRLEKVDVVLLVALKNFNTTRHFQWTMFAWISFDSGKDGFVCF